MMTEAGHTVLVEQGAGLGSSISDDEYLSAGAAIAANHAEVFNRSDMVLKVKEPLPEEYPLLRPGLILFTYLHLAANQTLTHAILKSGVTAIGYETVQLPDGRLPLLTPMSEIAGRLSIQIGAHYLERMNGGRGKLLAGVPGVPPADVVILGAGVVGANAAAIALGMGAHVTLLDINVERLRTLEERFTGNFDTLVSNRHNIADSIRHADLVIGAVLLPGAKAPRLVTRDMIGLMLPDSVIVDVSVDQGGCIETAHPTTHSNPTYVVDGVVHYCVANMPGAVPRTSTYALSNMTMPYALRLASEPLARAIVLTPELASGVNAYKGKLTYEAVGRAFGLATTPLRDLLDS